MLEKFTQKAIDIVQNAQIQAGNFNSDKVYSEHILLALALNSKTVEAKLMGAEKINVNELIEIINKKIFVKQKPKKREYISFSASAKSILEKSVEIAKQYNNALIMPAHIALSVFFSKNSGAYEILKEFDIDEEKIVNNLVRLIEKNSNKTCYKHPEKSEKQAHNNDIDALFNEESVLNLLKTAQSKLSTKGYEILGTEQIVQSILDNSDNEITKILEKYGISKENFDNELVNFSNRSEEYGERQIIFTPNAFRAMVCSLDAAREMGSVEIRPEHIILGILKAKTGIAYKIFNNLSNENLNFEEKLFKDINSSLANVPETLAILRFAKQEAETFNKKTVGTEMILLGILSQQPSIAYDVLKNLGITLKDARIEVEKLVGYGVEDNNEGFEYSERAKRMLDMAYEAAKKHGKAKIVSEHLLYAITKQQDCLAMKVLEALGTDVLEIKQGILKELEKLPMS